jgi:glycerol uptake facilitator-like aquaporin
MADARRRLLSEGLGTAILVATVVGSGIMAQALSKDVAVQLLANSLATAAILVVLISLLAPVSGAHFNPVVTLVAWLGGGTGLRAATAYVAVQCLGGLAGTMMAHAMFGMPLLMPDGAARAGAGLWFSECVATFLLVFCIAGAGQSRPQATPWLVALTILAAYWFTSSTSFANPAVTLARGFTASFSGIRLWDVPLYVVMQCIGGVAAFALSRWLFAPAAGARP